MDLHLSDGTHSTTETQFHKATIADLPLIVKHAISFYEMSPWNGLVSMDTTTVLDTFVHHIESETSLVLVGDECLFVATLVPCALNNTVLIAQELLWYGKNGRALIQPFEQWAKDNECNFTLMSSLVNDREPAIRRIYSKLGYTPIESAYIKGIT